MTCFIRFLVAALISISALAATAQPKAGKDAPVSAPPVPSGAVEPSAPAPSSPVITDLPTSGTEANQVSSGTLRLLRTLEAFTKDIKTVHARFNQVRRDPTFDETVKSKAELWYDKPTRFRCDYADPRPMITLIIDKTFYSYIPELEQVDKWEFDSIEQRDEQMHQLMIAFGFKTEELLKLYHIHSSEDETGPADDLKKMAEEQKWDVAGKALLTFTPRPEFAQQSRFTELKVYIDKARLLPEIIFYRDVDTDASVTVTMASIERDIPLDAALFNKSKVIPPGTTEIDKRNTQ